MRGLSGLVLTFGCVASLGGGSALAADLVINEFMAANTDTIVDEDGDYSDWLEIHNAGASTVDLDGFFLTDSEVEPARWRFPRVLLEGGAFLLVFASGKDRADPAGELHTNFRLTAAGEYLALVAPDGFTVVHEYEPAYPPQYEDYSYGSARMISTLIAAGAVARALVPTSGAGGLAVLSHPFTLELDEGALRACVRALSAAGLEGLEVYYSEHGAEQERQYLALAKEFGLVVTGGSDFHDRVIRPLGVAGIGRRDLDIFLEHVG